MPRTGFTGALLVLLSACATPSSGVVTQADFVTVGSQPANVGDAGRAALAYHDSGAYDRDLAAVSAEAKTWLASEAGKVARPALVFDIDETALSNWEIIKLDDFGRPEAGPCNPGWGAPCGWAAWDQLGRDPPMNHSPQRPDLRSSRVYRSVSPLAKIGPVDFGT